MELGNDIADGDLDLDTADFPSIGFDELVNVMECHKDIVYDEFKFDDFDFDTPDLATIQDTEEGVETQKVDSVELPKPKQGCGKGKEMALLIRHYKNPASPPPTKVEIGHEIPKNKNEAATKSGYQPQNWNDEAKLEGTKRKLHQLYDQDQAKKRKIQVIDIQSLSKPKPKPVRRVNNTKGKGFRANHCLVF